MFGKLWRELYLLLQTYLFSWQLNPHKPFMLLCVRYVLCLWDADLLPLIGRLDVDFQHVLFDASYDKIDAFRFPCYDS
jgi:hypothetical protein